MLKKRGVAWWGRTSRQNTLRKRCPGTRCRPEVELGAHTHRDVGGSGMGDSESSDQPIRSAEPASDGFSLHPLIPIWTAPYLIRCRFDLGGRQQD